MSPDRDAAIQKAEKLLRQGKLDAAIAEYVRLVDEYPRDWNAANVLGDLHLRAGDRDRAVEQFTRIADHLLAEGFVSRAAALYKKALRAKPDHDYTLLRLSETATRQGLLVDARQYLRQLGRLRRDRRDEQGSADVLVRLALLDEADADTQLQGARAAQDLGDTIRAAELFRRAGVALAAEGRHLEAQDALAIAGQLTSRSDAPGAAGAAVSTHASQQAASPDGSTASLLAAARADLTAGRELEARMSLTRLVASSPSSKTAVEALARELIAADAVREAFVCTEVLVDDALLAGDWDLAFGRIEAMLEGHTYIPALTRLVELAVDARRDDVLESAQARLADAYIESGSVKEARAIAEDLLARNPASEMHAARLRLTLALLGVADADAVIDRYRGETRAPEAEACEDAGIEGAPIAVEVRVEDANESADGPAAAAADDADAIVLDAGEIDLTDEIATLAAPGTADEGASPVDLEAVFDEMRRRVLSSQPGGDGSREYARGLEYLEQGKIAEAQSSLRAAARMPLYRFRASAQLGRLCLQRGDTEDGIEWLERAAEAPAPTAEEGWSVLYELADALQQIGENARALAVLLELQAHAGTYRDAPQRIDLLSRAETGGQ